MSQKLREYCPKAVCTFVWALERCHCWNGDRQCIYTYKVNTIILLVHACVNYKQLRSAQDKILSTKFYIAKQNNSLEALSST